MKKRFCDKFKILKRFQLIIMSNIEFLRIVLDSKVFKNERKKIPLSIIVNETGEAYNLQNSKYLKIKIDYKNHFLIYQLTIDSQKALCTRIDLRRDSINKTFCDIEKIEIANMIHYLMENDKLSFEEILFLQKQAMYDLFKELECKYLLFPENMKLLFSMGIINAFRGYYENDLYSKLKSVGFRIPRKIIDSLEDEQIREIKHYLDRLNKKGNNNIKVPEYIKSYKL